VVIINTEKWTKNELVRFWVVIAIAAALRLFFILVIKQPYSFMGDDRHYDLMVKQLLTEGIYGYGSHQPNAYVTPGFPLFLALVYKIHGFALTPFDQVRIYHTILLILVVALVYLIARKVSNPSVAFYSALIAAVYPPLIWSATSLLTETLFVTILLAYFYVMICALDKKSALLTGIAGLLFGITVLIRPQVAPFFIIPFLLEFKNSPKTIFKLALVFTLVFTMIQAPWWIRNYQIYDKVVLFATQTGNPMLAGADPYYKTGLKTIFKGIPLEKQTDIAISRIINGFKQDPLLYLKWFTVGKFTIMFSKPWLRYPYGFSMDSFAKVIHIFLVTTGWVGVLLFLSQSKTRIISSFVIILTSIHLLFLPLPRYAFPLMPFLIICAVQLLSCFPRISQK
jgi:4-amino-4-deoxy-L-arabinose transferase-like glycosyltransferase